MKPCRGRAARILRAAEDGLPIEEQLALEEHARGCRACGAALDAVRALDAALARLPEPPLERVDAARAALRVRAEIDHRERADRRPLILRRAGLAAAAALALFAAAFWLAAHPARDPRPPLASGASGEAAPAIRADASDTPAGIDGPTKDDQLVADAPLAVPAPAGEVARFEPDAARAFETPAEAFDAARLAGARSAVRFALAAESSQFDLAGPSSARADFAASFERRIAGLAREGWPLVRLVEGFARDPDATLASAAIAWLGQRGDRIALASVSGLLEREDLGSSAARALADAGTEGLELLAAALDLPASRPPALEALAARGQEADVDVLKAGCARAAARGDERGAVLCSSALGTLGSRGVDALVALLADPRARPTALDAIAAAPGAGDSLTRICASDARLDRAALLAAVARTMPPGAVDFVASCALDRAHRAPALDCLAAYASPAALAALAALHSSGAMPPSEVERAFRAALERSPSSARELATEAARRGDARAAADLYAALSADPCSASVPGLVALVASPSLDRLERRTALELVLEHGDERDAAALGELYGALDARDAALRALALVALDALGGRAAVEAALAGAPAVARARVLALLSSGLSRAQPISTSLRLARSLETALADPHP